MSHLALPEFRHEAEYWRKAHHRQLVKDADDYRRAKEAMPDRRPVLDDVLTSVLVSTGDVLVACGLWLRARSRSVHAQ